MVGSKSTIIDNAKKIVEALIRNNAVAPNNRLSRHDAVAATGLDEETFDVSYGFLRRSMYVEAPISESGMSATPTGISWYEAAIAQRHPTLRQKIGSQPVLSVISIIVMVLLGVGGTYFGVASNQNFWPFASHTPTLVQSPTRAPTFSPTFPPTAVKPGQHPPLFLDTECSTLDQDDPGIALRVEGFSIDKFGNAIATVTIIDARQELSSVKPYHFGSWQLVDNINHEVHGYRTFQGSSGEFEYFSPGNKMSGQIEFRNSMSDTAEAVALVFPPFSPLTINLKSGDCGGASAPE